jgi:ActR/RegA family two-component response regulator
LFFRAGICIAEQICVLSINPNGKPRVLVVDDDLAMCNFLRTFLSERGYAAITIGNAEDAVKY